MLNIIQASDGTIKDSNNNNWKKKFDDGLILLLCLLLTFLFYYFFIKKSSTKQKKEKNVDKEKLISWINERISKNPIKNLTTDWNDGKSLGCLLNFFDSNLFSDCEKWNENNALKHIKEAMETAEKVFCISQIATPNNMRDPNVDEEIMMAYLSQFYNVNIESKPILEEEIKAVKSPVNYVAPPDLNENINESTQSENSEKNEESNSNEETGKTIAIDFGTSFSKVSVMMDDKVISIKDKEGNNIIPSYIAFTKDDQIIIGNAAKMQLFEYPENVVYNINRVIGKTFDDVILQQDMKSLSYKILNKNNKPIIEIQMSNGIRLLTPEEVVSMILRHLKDLAEDCVKEKIYNAVITVPALFNNSQRQAIMNAGLIAGLINTRIINEQTAAALSYEPEKLKDKNDCIIVVDFGGGSLSVSLFKNKNGDMQVIATSGDSHLGGEEFDQNLLNYFIDLYKDKKDIQNNKIAIQKLRMAIEKAKRELSFNDVTIISIESFMDGEDFKEILTRLKFEEINEDIFASILKCLENVMEDCQMNSKDIDNILLVGGSTNIPKIQQLVLERFDDNQIIKLSDDNQTAAAGACLDNKILVNDVCTLSLGIGMVKGMMSKIIPRNTSIPTMKSKLYSTVADNQLSIKVPVYQGEQEMTKDNNYLGEFILSKIAIAPKGVPKFKVTFEIDRNGILKVSAIERGTTNKKEIVISNYQNQLSPEDIKRIIEGAEKETKS